MGQQSPRALQRCWMQDRVDPLPGESPILLKAALRWGSRGE